MSHISNNIYNSLLFGGDSNDSNDEKEDEQECKKYAYVVLVMNGDDYIPGAVTLAESIRYSGTKFDIVCMITNDVTQTGQDILLTIFDYIIEVPYIKFESKPLKLKRQRELYGSWNPYSYTKWNAINLTQYKKVLCLDADMISVNKSLDHIFELDAPAATFSTPWAVEFKTEKYRKKEIEQLGHEEEFHLRYDAKKHEQKVHPIEISNSITSGGYAFIASMVLLEPNRKEFKEFKKFIKENEPFGLNCFGGCDEQSLAYYYSVKNPKIWTYIYQKYNFIVHKPTWIKPGEIPEMLHYFADKKPWQTDKLWKDTVWNSDNLWWSYFHRWIVKNKITKDILEYMLKFKDESKYDELLIKKQNFTMIDIFHGYIKLSCQTN
jgi:alpha-N-acetylglucosamine transferase